MFSVLIPSNHLIKKLRIPFKKEELENFLRLNR